MISFLRRNSVLIVTGILLLVSGSLLLANSRGPRRVDPLGSILLEALSPLDRVLGAMRGSIGRVWSNYVDVVGAREEAAWLRKRLREVDQRREGTTGLERENARLRALLDLRDRMPGQGIAAPVTSAETKGLFHSATLGKGSRDGIAPGMAVVSADGVVGLVFQASPSAARVLLLEDPSSGIDAIDARTRARGIVEGGPGDGCRLKFVKRDDEIHVGDELVTSGLDGTFPKGVPIGTITAIVPGERGLFRSAEVKPAVDFSKVEEVLVVATAPTDLPPEAARSRPPSPASPPAAPAAPAAAAVPARPADAPAGAPPIAPTTGGRR